MHDAAGDNALISDQVCYARIQDSQKKFLEASLKYYTLSQIQDETIPQDDILTLLFSAVWSCSREPQLAYLQQLTCACLAKAGPQRSRIMDTLHRDARTPMVDGFFMLDKMYKGEIVRKAEVERFRALLLPHHVAVRTQCTLSRTDCHRNCPVASQCTTAPLSSTTCWQRLGCTKVCRLMALEHCFPLIPAR